MNFNQEIKIKTLNGKNFQTWKFRITTAVEKLGLEEFLITDIYNNSKKSDKKVDEEINKCNATVRDIIINSMEDNILKDYLNVKSAYAIMERLKKKYGGSQEDIKYWIKKLNSLRAKSENEIPTVLDDMFDIFKSMEENGLKISDNEKLKFMYSAMTKEFRRTLTITTESKPCRLKEEINNRITMKAYLENWNIDKEFYNDDPMEIDEIRRFKKKGFVKSKSEKEKHNEIKRKQKEVEKYCHICDRYDHSTKECFYNLKTKNSNWPKKNYHKKEFRNKFIDEINKTNFEESDDEGEDFTKLKIYTGNIDAIINEEEEEEIIEEEKEEKEEKEEEKEM